VSSWGANSLQSARKNRAREKTNKNKLRPNSIHFWVTDPPLTKDRGKIKRIFSSAREAARSGGGAAKTGFETVSVSSHAARSGRTRTENLEADGRIYLPSKGEDRHGPFRLYPRLTIELSRRIYPMKALYCLAGSMLVASLSAQVTAPPGTVTAPNSPVTAPPGIPNPNAQPGGLINPAVPTAVPPQTAGRTFQTPFLGGPPAPSSTIQTGPNGLPVLGIPPVVAPGTISINGPTNIGLTGRFGTNIAGFAGTDVVGRNLVVPFTNALPPIINPAGAPVVIDLPPGSVVGTTQPPGRNPVGTPLIPGFSRPFPNPPGTVAGNPPARQQGTSGARPPSVVRPQP
jgi:hypothetical protein